MIYQQGLTTVRLANTPVIFALGSFDGVHLGHQYLLSNGRRIADERQALFTVFTFSSLPRNHVVADDAALFLTTPYHKRLLLSQAGVDMLIEVPFSEELRSLSAKKFLQVVHQMVLIDTWLGGSDLRFGRNGEGNCAVVEAWAEQIGAKTAFLDRIGMTHETISSSRIRRAIASGDLSLASTLLGRSYSFFASRIDLPEGQETTVALDAAQLCLPPDGLYQVGVEAGQRSCEAVLRLCRSTASLMDFSIDANLLLEGKVFEIVPQKLLRKTDGPMT